MTPSSRLRLSVAPRFHLAADWAGRLAAAAGVSEAGGRFFPRGPWRPLTPDEITRLTSGPGPSPGEDPGAGCLFRLPDHLSAAWWELLDRSAAAGGASLPGFEGFTDRVTEFLKFKHLGPPPTLRMEAVVTAAGRCSLRSDPETGAPAGLGPSLPPEAACPLPDGPLPRLWAVVNLGDEDTRLVLISLPISGLAADLSLRAPGPPPPTVGELVGRFLREFPDCPPLRLRLGPGEGFRLPPGGLILDGDATDKQEPDVLLLISEQPLTESGGSG
jgi:hypothetical protein